MKSRNSLFFILLAVIIYVVITIGKIILIVLALGIILIITRVLVYYISKPNDSIDNKNKTVIVKEEGHTVNDESLPSIPIDEIKYNKGYDHVMPPWSNTNMFSFESLKSANKVQREFYEYFKAKYIKGEVLDVGENYNYPLLLMYDFIKGYHVHYNYDLICSQLEALSLAYPTIKSAIKLNQNSLSKECKRTLESQIQKTVNIYRKQNKANDDVPFWSSFRVFSLNDLQQATSEQQKFYFRFKSEFIKGNVISIGNNLNYVFILMYDLIEDYKAHKNINNVKTQFELLSRRYPQISDYYISLLAKTRIEVDKKIKEVYNVNGEKLLINGEKEENIKIETISEVKLERQELAYDCTIEVEKLTENEKNLAERNLGISMILQSLINIIEKVPSWSHFYVYSAEDLQYANNDQREFYNYFKAEFLKEHVIDLGDNLNYAFILMFDLIEDYKKHNDYFKTMAQLNLLGKRYAKTKKYSMKALYETIIEMNNNEIYDSIKKNSLTKENKLFLPYFVDINKYDKVIQFKKELSKKLICDNYYITSVNGLLQNLEYDKENEKNLHKEDVYVIIKTLQMWGYGIAPNYEIDNKKFNFGNMCVIYNISKDVTYRNNENNSIMIIFVKFASVILLADTIEQNDENFVYNIICKLEENDSNRKHIMAYFKWLVVSKSKLDSKMGQMIEDEFKNKVELKALIVNDLIGLCCIEGVLSTKRVEVAKKKLPLFGLDVSNIHSRIHRLITGETEEFVTIENETGSENYAITKHDDNGFYIDEEKLKKIEKDTVESQTFLHKIFDDEESDGSKKEDVPIVQNKYFDLLSILLTKRVWNRQEVESLCVERNLIIGAALEWINDYSYAKVDDAVIEDNDDRIEVNTEYKNQLK